MIQVLVYLLLWRHCEIFKNAVFPL